MKKTEPLKPPQYDISLLRSSGEDIFISANAEIRRPHLMSVGSHVAIDTGYYTTEADIGDYVHLGPYISCIGGEKSKLVVGHFVAIGAGSRIICGSDAQMGDGFTSVTVPEKYRDTVKYTTVKIGDFAGIGTNVIIMPGVTIGEGSVIGACSLVTADTEPWTVYCGTPARPIKIRPKEKILQFAEELGYR